MVPNMRTTHAGLPGRAGQRDGSLTRHSRVSQGLQMLRQQARGGGLPAPLAGYRDAGWLGVKGAIASLRDAPAGHP